jgi:hypothetical protein
MLFLSLMVGNDLADEAIRGGCGRRPRAGGDRGTAVGDEALVV